MTIMMVVMVMMVLTIMMFVMVMTVMMVVHLQVTVWLLLHGQDWLDIHLVLQELLGVLCGCWQGQGKCWNWLTFTEGNIWCGNQGLPERNLGCLWFTLLGFLVELGERVYCESPSSWPWRLWSHCYGGSFRQLDTCQRSPIRPQETRVSVDSICMSFKVISTTKTFPTKLTLKRFFSGMCSCTLPIIFF